MRETLKDRGNIRLLLALGYSAMIYSGTGIGLVETQERAGVSTGLLGAVGAAALLTGFLGELLLAPLADRGRTRTLLLTSVLAASFGGVALGLAGNAAVLLLGRVLVNLSLGIVVPLTYGALVRNNNAQRARLLALASGFQYLAHAVGAFGIAAAIDAFGVQRSFLTTGIAGVVLVPVVWRSVGPATTGPQDQPPLFAFGLLRDRHLQAALLLSIAFTLPVGLNSALWDRYVTDTVQRSGADPNFVNSLTYLLWAVPYVLLTGIGGRIAERAHRSRVVWSAHLPIALTSVLYALALGPVTLLGASATDGTLQGLLWPLVMLHIADKVPAERSTAAQSLTRASASLAAFLVAFVTPVIYQAHGPRTTYLSVAVGTLLVGAVARNLGRREPVEKPGRSGTEQDRRVA
jgi:MFS family permease